MVVVDASVVYKWIVDEEPLTITKQARILLRSLLKDEEKIVAPNILLYEIGNVFAYKTELELEDIEEVWQQFSRLPVSFIDPSLDFVELCLNFSKKYKVSVYDASYAVLAKEKKCDFITADAKFVRQVSLSYVRLLK